MTVEEMPPRPRPTTRGREHVPGAPRWGSRSTPTSTPPVHDGVLLLEQGDFDARGIVRPELQNRFGAPEDGANVILYKIKRAATTRVVRRNPRAATPTRPGSASARFITTSTSSSRPSPRTRRPPATNATFYDEALIRMAWTVLRRDFATAVERLDEFVRYADKVKGTEAGMGRRSFEMTPSSTSPSPTSRRTGTATAASPDRGLTRLERLHGSGG